MAETFFPQVLPDLAMKMVIMWKPQRVYSITKNSYETLVSYETQFTFWDTLCDLHKQAHAHTNYFVHPINMFYFHNLPGVIALVLHSHKDVFDTSHLCVRVCVYVFLRKTVCFPENPLTQDYMSSFE